MKSFIQKNFWVFEIIAACLLLGLGITIEFKNDILLVSIGCVYFGLGIFRFLSIFKNKQFRIIKYLNIIEFAINIILGIMFIVLGCSGKRDPDSNTWIGYLICSALYVRGLFYLFSTAYKKEQINIFLFFVNIIMLTLATVLISKDWFSLEILDTIFMIICVFCALCIACDSFWKHKECKKNTIVENNDNNNNNIVDENLENKIENEERNNPNDGLDE